MRLKAGYVCSGADIRKRHRRLKASDKPDRKTGSLLSLARWPHAFPHQKRTFAYSAYHTDTYMGGESRQPAIRTVNAEQKSHIRSFCLLRQGIMSYRYQASPLRCDPGSLIFRFPVIYPSFLA
jgi:hypothetical protein